VRAPAVQHSFLEFARQAGLTVERTADGIALASDETSFELRVAGSDYIVTSGPSLKLSFGWPS